MFKFLNKGQSSSRQPQFRLPAPDPFENPLVETQPGPLRQWVATLPFANPEQMAETVITSLSRLNRFPGPVRKRMGLMEIYLTPSTRLYHHTSDSKSSALRRLNRQLMMEMAYGYLHLVNECLQEKPSSRQNKRLLHPIYFAVKFLAYEHLLACEEYDCCSTTTRQELIRLHTLAEERNLLHEPVDDTDQPEPEKATISHQVKRSLLLSLLDPCHLQQGESRTIFNYLDGFAQLARFESLESDGAGAGHYVFDRRGEVAPCLYDPASNEGLTSPRFHLLNLIPVSQQLHRHLRDIEQPAGTIVTGLEHLSHKAAGNLLRRMLKSWHIRLKRDSERHQTTGEAMLWIGLPSIHQFLSQGKTPHQDPDSSQDEIAVTLDAGGASTHARPSFQQLTGWRFNQSRSGVALHLPLPLASTPQVGEMVLIARPNTSKRDEWKIGIIRRALLRDQRILEIGVQFVPGRFVPLSLQPLDVEEDTTPPISPGLYIDLGEVDRSSLIVQRDVLTLSQEYRVEEMIPAPIITPVHLTEVTAMLESYKVKRV